MCSNQLSYAAEPRYYGRKRDDFATLANGACMDAAFLTVGIGTVAVPFVVGIRSLLSPATILAEYRIGGATILAGVWANITVARRSIVLQCPSGKGLFKVNRTVGRHS